jgi:ribosomal protein S10
MDNQNIRIHLKAYDNKILDLSTEEIVKLQKELALRLEDQYLYLLE